MKKINLSELALIPGPAEIPQPFSSVNVQCIAEYTATEITDALLEIKFIELKTTDINSMWDWKAEFTNSSASIVFEMTCMGESDEFWGGFQLQGYGNKEHILSVWEALNAKGFTAVWIHDADCNMYTREGFLEEYSDYA